MPKILNIITHPNPNLRKMSAPVPVGDIALPKIQELIDDMTVTMLKKDGVGLAAPQIGQNIRIIVINFKDNIFVMINPSITKRSWAKKVSEEGCLSVPNVFGNVSRYKRLTCEYFDKNGAMQKIEASDMFARIIQHETDHLDGILFIDKAEKINKS